ncbi:hypothetical protein GGE67_003519 [Rhizobium leucaenae]|jgi:hypothetical protein|uniref:Uncharacterized protein n=1 Tax=Rhizobium leucaenae TaxID=29450 RepID=A0A7W6ZWX6_9HYPH|nr:hypothetical protein [Rhizobium leucaenae]MBB6302894.1 hypothetical protein [Rhizobium leucaenae]
MRHLHGCFYFRAVVINLCHAYLLVIEETKQR